MTQLIDITDIQEFKELSSNLNAAKKINPYIIEAQQFDIDPFLGDTLYLLLEADFETSPSLQTQKYIDLFNGSTYTVGAAKFRHNGIRSVLAYYSYSRIIANSKVNSTAFGLVEKENSHSEGVNEKTLARQVSGANALAAAEQEKVRKFICNHLTDYPEWVHANKYAKRPIAGVKIRSIGQGRNKIGGSAKCRNCWRYTCIC